MKDHMGDSVERSTNMANFKIAKFSYFPLYYLSAETIFSESIAGLHAVPTNIL